MLDILERELEEVVEIMRTGYREIANIPWIRNNPCFEVLSFTGDLNIGLTWHDIEGKASNCEIIKTYEFASHEVN